MNCFCEMTGGCPFSGLMSLLCLRAFRYFCMLYAFCQEGRGEEQLPAGPGSKEAGLCLCPVGGAAFAAEPHD